MTEEPNSLMLQYLRSIDHKIDLIEDHVADLNASLTRVERHLSGVETGVVGIERRIDGIEQRLDRIEQRGFGA